MLDQTMFWRKRTLMSRSHSGSPRLPQKAAIVDLREHCGRAVVHLHYSLWLSPIAALILFGFSRLLGAPWLPPAMQSIFGITS